MINPWIKTHSFEMSIFIVALLFSGALLLYLHNTFEFTDERVGGVDFADYDILARNIVAGNGLSLRNAPPYEPSAIRTPGYPLFLAAFYFIFGNRISAIIMQIFLLAGVGVLSYRILLLFGISQRIAWMGAFLTIIEPDVMSSGIYLLSDLLFTFFLLLSFYFFLHFSDKKNIASFLWASWFLSVSAVIRPLSLILLPIYLAVFIRLMGIRLRVLVPAVFLSLSLLIPWSLRNFSEFGTFKLTSVDYYGLYGVIGSQIISFRDGVSYGEARAGLLEEFVNAPELQPIPEINNISSHYPKEEFLLLDSFRYHKWMLDKFFGIFLSSPVLYVKVLFWGTVEYFNHVNWLTPLEHWDILRPVYQPSVSYRQILSDEGLGGAYRELIRRFSCGVSCFLSFSLVIGGRIYWALLMIFSVIGIKKLSVSFEDKRPVLFAFIVFAVGFALLHVSIIGTLVPPRYRMPLVPFFTGFALVGMYSVWHKLRDLWFAGK